MPRTFDRLFESAGASEKTRFVLKFVNSLHAR